MTFLWHFMTFSKLSHDIFKTFYYFFKTFLSHFMTFLWLFYDFLKTFNDFFPDNLYKHCAELCHSNPNNWIGVTTPFKQWFTVKVTNKMVKKKCKIFTFLIFDSWSFYSDDRDCSLLFLSYLWYKFHDISSV